MTKSEFGGKFAALVRHSDFVIDSDFGFRHSDFLRFSMSPLPIDRYLPEITAKLRESRSLVLVAPPGAGKTTRVPPAVLRAGLLPAAHPNLVMLQPRRVAARAAAQRIAEENAGWDLGREVGYHVRF